MPLKNSPRDADLKSNIKTLMGEVGSSPKVKSRDQALAIVYAVQRRAKARGRAKNRAVGGAARAIGVALDRASGGIAPAPNFAAPRQLVKGPLISRVPGRTDSHAAKVPSGAYVIPADIVSGRGQGNTLAGVNTLERVFKMGPHGVKMPPMARSPNWRFGRGFGVRPPRAVAHAEGGSADGGDEQLVPVNLAGGELVVPPENLLSVVHPDLDRAHAIMDQWVLDERKKLQKTLGALPGPAKD